MEDVSNRVIVGKYLSHKLSRRGLEWACEGPRPGEGPRTAVHRVLREAGDELERLYRPDFTDMSRRLRPLTDTSSKTRFADVIDELFRGGVTWGRVIAFFEFGATVCVKCASTEDMRVHVDNIAAWMTEYLDLHLDPWIHDNGGWEAFVELYDPQRESLLSRSWPSVKTLCGLAALGAASITIGAFLTQQ